MKICEYINNITDIKYIHMLILNRSIPKRIGISKDMHENYNVYYLLSVDPMYNFYFIYTTLKVRLRNIKYPFLELSDTQEHPYIWEGKTTRIDILREIKLIFGFG